MGYVEDSDKPRTKLGAVFSSRLVMKIPRRQYNDLYGPTAGDRIRLADTELLIEITRDLTVPGEEAKFGGGKVIRDGMGQSPAATRARARWISSLQMRSSSIGGAS